MEYDARQRQCIQLLQERARVLSRAPKKGDFSEQAVCQIKNLLGPWPRALEAAGLKETAQPEREQRNREKRIRTKRRRVKKRESEAGYGTDQL